jgi:hypothetical protein
MRPAYTDLYFGMSDSRNEEADEFVRSYVDLESASEGIVGGKKFLVLGPKGAGKSAVARYLELTEHEGNHLCLTRDASSLPLAEIPKLQTGQDPGPDRSVVSWKFILLCNYLGLLLRDQSCSLQGDPEVSRVVALLRNFGFMGDASGRALLDFVTTTWTIPIPKVGPVYKRESTRTVNIYNLLPILEDWVVNATSSVRHVLLLDGLDSIFLNSKEYDDSLSSMVYAAYSLNQLLRESAASGNIVLLLRYDVFARVALKLPDSQKMRDDLAIDLDWRVKSGAAGARAPLLNLVNRKAARALDVEHLDVLSYFPEKIQVGGKGSSRRSFKTLQYFLNLTRHTPRDLLQLFEHLRRVAAADIYDSDAANDKLSAEVIREGVVQYCSKYFEGAIRNEFAGFEEGEHTGSADDAIAALQHLGKERFNRAEFSAMLEADTDSRVRVGDRLLKLLFYAGAIGNIVAGRNESYLHFYHRSDNVPIYLRGEFALHNALVHAWSVPRGGGVPLQ